MSSKSISNSLSLSKLNINTDTDNVTIGNDTLTELLKNKTIISGEGVGNILVYDQNDPNKLYYNNNLITNNNEIIISTNLIPNENIQYSLGNNKKRWKELYIGPGTINISGPDPNVFATLGADNKGVAYTEFGFATPLINIGASSLTPGVVGGWKVSASGVQGSPSYDLIAQEISISGSES